MDSLPNELIVEIGINIGSPADTARFSLVCKNFYNCADKYKINWFAKMRSVIKEINAIEYRIGGEHVGICDLNNDNDNHELDVKSYRRRDMIVTFSCNMPTARDLVNGTNDSVLRISQEFPTNKINSYRKKRLCEKRYEPVNKSSRVIVRTSPNDFCDKQQFVTIRTGIYHNCNTKYIL
jgi:hypothetical protein